MKFLGKAVRNVGIAVLAAVLAYGIWQSAARRLSGQELPGMFGYSHLIVVSGSMEPALSPGDMILIRRESEYREGDVICFRDDGDFVTHRLVGRTADGAVTKGDANNIPDPEPVRPEQIAGRVVLVIPRLGSAALFLRTPGGILLAALLALGVSLLCGPAHRLRKRPGTRQAAAR